MTDQMRLIFVGYFYISHQFTRGNGRSFVLASVIQTLFRMVKMPASSTVAQSHSAGDYLLGCSVA